MTTMTIDSSNQTIEADIDLKGEVDPIQLKITGYNLDTQGDCPTFSARAVTVSREWMNVLATELLIEKRIPISPKTKKWLQLLL